MTTRALWGGALAAGMLLAGCPSEHPPDPGRPAEDLAPPEELEGVDMDLAVVEAVELLTRTTTRAPWAGHVASLDRIGGGCPTLWEGTPSALDGDAGDDGQGWQDRCSSSNTLFDGAVGWEAVATPEARVVGSRNLAAAASVTDGDSVLFSFVGEASDSLAFDNEGARWTYSSELLGEVDGIAAVDPDLAPVVGFRGGNTTTWVGGDRWSLAIDANVAFYVERVAGVFDSVDVDMFMPGPGADDGGCALEPHGRVSMRVTPGDWIDVAFWEPPPEGTDPDQNSLEACDGCGTVKVRGVGLGEACPDFSSLWTAERLPSGTLDDYVLPLREQLSEDP